MKGTSPSRGCNVLNRRKVNAGAYVAYLAIALLYAEHDFRIE